MLNFMTEMLCPLSFIISDCFDGLYNKMYTAQTDPGVVGSETAPML